MNASKKQEEIIEDDDESERYFDYYIKKNTMWISIFMSMFVLLDVLAIFLTTNYTFLEIFLYFGILMILAGSGVLYFIWQEKNYFWATMASFFLGLTTFRLWAICDGIGMALRPTLVVACMLIVYTISA